MRCAYEALSRPGKESFVYELSGGRVGRLTCARSKERKRYEAWFTIVGTDGLRETRLVSVLECRTSAKALFEFTHALLVHWKTNTPPEMRNE